MRIAHIADLHVTDGPRLGDHEETLRGIVEDAIEAGVDLWILAGDLYGREVPHRSTPKERGVLYAQVVRMARTAPVVVCYGNHDFDPDLDTMELLDGDFPIRVVKRPEVLRVATAAGACNVYVLPYPTKRWLLTQENAPKGLVAAQEAANANLGGILAGWGQRIRDGRAEAPSEPHVLVAHLQVSGSATAGGEVLAGNEIEVSAAQLEELGADYGALGHIHLRQEVALRCWYPGSPWRNDFSEIDAKGWHLVKTDDRKAWVAGNDRPLKPELHVYPAMGERLWVSVEHRLSACRSFVTLDYRWAEAEEDGAPGWTERPEEEELEGVNGAEVRMRLSVPEQWVAGCPWDQVVASVRARGAHRIVEERRIEPTLRVRAPAVAAAIDIPSKVEAFWGVLATPPSVAEREAAMACLDELLTTSDDVIAENSRTVIGAGLANSKPPVVPALSPPRGKAEKDTSPF